MSDFKFIQNPLSKKWVVLAPKRAGRPDEAKKTEDICPFCLGNEETELEVYRVGGNAGDANWQIRVLPNKYPFAPIHEVIIHSPDHHKNFGELELAQVELVFKTYRQRFLTHQDKGQVYIFHNRGEAGGESLIHPHSQLAVIPNNVAADIQPPQQIDQNTIKIVQTNNFNIFCPLTSQWPDEVWFASKVHNKVFGEISDKEVTDLSSSLSKIIKILELRHGREFPYNFYIYPGKDWYLRIIPRTKSLGGFEIGAGIFVNTQDPKETINFIKENF